MAITTAQETIFAIKITLGTIQSVSINEIPKGNATQWMKSAHTLARKDSPSMEMPGNMVVVVSVKCIIAH